MGDCAFPTIHGPRGTNTLTDGRIELSMSVVEFVFIGWIRSLSDPAVFVKPSNGVGWSVPKSNPHVEYSMRIY